MTEEKLNHLKRIFLLNISDINLIISADLGQVEIGLDDESIELIKQLVKDCEPCTTA
jgi:hypothetical protein